MSIDKVKSILDEQIVRIKLSQSIIELTENYQKKCFENGKILDSYKHILIVQLMLTDWLIINLDILFNGDEQYSLIKLANNTLKVEKNAEIKKIKRECSKTYSNEDINYIRKKFCAHLDLDREDKEIPWSKIKLLLEKGCKLHDLISLHYNLNETSWSFNDLNLNYMIDDRQKLIAIGKLQREELSKGLQTIDINILGKILYSI